mmetsp:Transcript_3871/g.12837  ORF Transcript_3871/g.12837 Transcript_3871/m.12837 type:complete len:203 (+) Transcript_3871:494-1102(+)
MPLTSFSNDDDFNDEFCESCDDVASRSIATNGEVSTFSSNKSIANLTTRFSGYKLAAHSRNLRLAKLSASSSSSSPPFPPFSPEHKSNFDPTKTSLIDTWSRNISLSRTRFASSSSSFPTDKEEHPTALASTTHTIPLKSTCSFKCSFFVNKSYNPLGCANPLGSITNLSGFTFSNTCLMATRNGIDPLAAQHTHPPGISFT